MTVAFRRSPNGPAERDPARAAAGARPDDRTLIPVYDPAALTSGDLRATALPAGILGFQICTRDGENIQGDEDDPSGHPSYAILDAATASAIIAAHGEQYGLALQVIFVDEIEEPDFVRAAA